MRRDHGARLADPRRTLILITALGAVLRFSGLGRQSIWVDESLTVAWAGIFEGMTWERFLVNLQGPFHAVILFLWSRLFGTGEAGLRSLEALIGTATIPALYWALRPAGRPAPALIAAALLALSPFHLWYSQEIRGYCLMILCAVLSMGLFFRLPGLGLRGWVGYAATNVAGLLCSLAHAFLLAAQGAARFFLRNPGKGFRRGFLLSLALTLLLLSPWMVQFYERRVRPSGALESSAPANDEERARGNTAPPLLGIPYTYAAFSFGFSYGPSLREYHEMRNRGARAVVRPYAGWLLWAGVAFGITGLLGTIGLFRREARDRTWLWLAILPVLLNYGASARNLKVMNPRYAAAAFPAYLVVLAEGLLAPRSRAARAALAGALLVPVGVSLAQYRTEPRYAKEDARGAAEWIREKARPGDGLFLVGTDFPLRLYYWQRQPRASFDLPVEDAWHWIDLSRDEQGRRFDDFRREHSRLFVLFLRPKELDPEGFWSARIPEREAQEVRELTGVRILVLPGGAPAGEAGNREKREDGSRETGGSETGAGAAGGTGS